MFAGEAPAVARNARRALARIDVGTTVLPTYQLLRLRRAEPASLALWTGFLQRERAVQVGSSSRPICTENDQPFVALGRVTPRMFSSTARLAIATGTVLSLDEPRAPRDAARQRRLRRQQRADCRYLVTDPENGLCRRRSPRGP